MSNLDGSTGLDCIFQINILIKGKVTIAAEMPSGEINQVSFSVLSDSYKVM
jgi:hypothetical protein